MVIQVSAQELDPSFNLIAPILIIIIFFIALLLIRRTKLSNNMAIWVSILSFLGVGVILGGRPNPVNALNQVLDNFIPTTPTSFRLFLSALGVFTLLSLSVVFFSRIFCGYACPLGSMQELTSKLNFKSSLKAQRKVKYSFDPPEKIIGIIRWGYFGLFGITAIIGGFSLSQHLDPFNGFQFMEELAFFTIIFLFIIFISSIFIYRPWCRILCPFGAISSLISFSRLRYKRTDACTDCALCEKICPSHSANRGDSKTECYYCNRCIDICPHNAIKYVRITSIKV
jgi:polyferredoxin